MRIFVSSPVKITIPSISGVFLSTLPRNTIWFPVKGFASPSTTTLPSKLYKSGFGSSEMTSAAKFASFSSVSQPFAMTGRACLLFRFVSPSSAIVSM